MLRKMGAELLGTFLLVFGGCGSALISAAFPHLGIGFAGVSLAFGLTVLTMIYAVGYISGGHFNPAITLGFWASGRFSAKDILPYIITQVIAAIAASGLLYLVVSGAPGFVVGGFASNGYGHLSPGHYSLLAAMVCEIICTFFFLTVILGVTGPGGQSAFAGVAIGLALTLLNLVSIPVDNASLNPARSTGPALIAGHAYLGQLWLFWVAPIVGAVVAGLVYRLLKAKAD